MTCLRYDRWAILAGVVAVGAVLAWGWWEDRRLPRYEGRSVRAWFAELCRHESGWNYRSEARVWECKTALVRMGTNAVPFLVGEALLDPRDTTLRTKLHALFRELPAWIGGGGFVPRSEVVGQAGLALRSLRPPPELVLPHLRDRLARTNTGEQRQAVLLLGGLNRATPEVLAALVPALTNTTDPWLPALADQSLQGLGVSASNALPVVVGKVASGKPSVLLYRWLADLGPMAEPAIPGIERFLNSTNDWVRHNAAAALLAIQPVHAEARRTVEATLRLAEKPEVGDPGGLGLRPGSLDSLGHVLCLARWRLDPALVGQFELLARREIAAWNPRWASFRATTVLDRHAPDRAAALYREALTDSSTAYAAGCLLRLERTNAEAARRLIEVAGRNVPDAVSAMWWLGEASSTTPGVTNFLVTRAAASGRAGGGGGGPAVSSANAAAALARLRHREARLAAGLPENEW